MQNSFMGLDEGKAFRYELVSHNSIKTSEQIHSIVDLGLYVEYEPAFRHALVKNGALTPIAIDEKLLPFEKKTKIFFNPHEKKFITHVDPKEIYHKALRECSLAKRGQIIHLRHLLPYISRITHLPFQQFLQIQKGYFDTLAQKIQKNIDRLDELLKKEQVSDELYALVEPEISVQECCNALQTDKFNDYFFYIKALDARLCYNYNLCQFNRSNL